MRVTYVGHKPAFSPNFSFGSSDVTVPELKLSKITGNLSHFIFMHKKIISK